MRLSSRLVIVMQVPATFTRRDNSPLAFWAQHSRFSLWSAMAPRHRVAMRSKRSILDVCAFLSFVMTDFGEISFWNFS